MAPEGPPSLPEIDLTGRPGTLLFVTSVIFI